MNNVTAIQAQSLLDISVQEYGTPTAVLAIAFQNRLAVTDELAAGQVLELPDYDLENLPVAGYYLKKQVWPSTAIADEVNDIIENVDICNYCKCFT
jgi:hypothetical protein